MIADPQRLLDNAVAFHEAGTRCYREEPAKISADGTDVFLGAPSVVCYAFAIELYLKLLSLLTKDSYDKRSTGSTFSSPSSMPLCRRRSSGTTPAVSR